MTSLKTSENGSRWKSGGGVSVLNKPSVQLGISGLISWWLYVGVVWSSHGFSYETPGTDRPLLSVMAIFGKLFVLYLFQVGFVLRATRGKAAGGNPDGERRCDGDPVPPRDGTENIDEATGGAAGVLPVIVVFAVAFRVLLLFSEPIQEVDAYRYLWDGQAAAAGINPFRFSPQQVLDASAGEASPIALRELVRLRDSSGVLREILHRIHYGELTTVYPPVSQAVFALAAVTTPESASLATHLLLMKSCIVLFDLAAVWGLIRLLRLVRRPPEWSIIYAWCPLVMKEFANSGHLDSIAVCLTIAALYCAVRGLFGEGSSPVSAPGTCNREGPGGGAMLWNAGAALLLGLGVGAKIYPAVFAPLLVLSIWRRVTFREAFVSGIIFGSVSLVMVLPMLDRDKGGPDEWVARTGSIKQAPAGTTSSDSTALIRPGGSDRQPMNDILAGHLPLPAPDRQTAGTVMSASGSSAPVSDGVERGIPAEAELPAGTACPQNRSEPEGASSGASPLPLLPDSDAAGRDESLAASSPGRSPTEPSASTGLAAFAARWQMNDFLFLLLFENLTPDRESDSTRTAWFVITGADWRERFVHSISEQTGVPVDRVPFLVTRLVTMLVFGGLVLWWASRAARSRDGHEWLMFAFLTVAWFWLLLPTQNPWYWTWALPLAAFARSRAWLLLSGLTLIYYLRFWCLYHAADTPLFGTRYPGVDFFDFIATWIEFAPWLLVLMSESLWRRFRLIQ